MNDNCCTKTFKIFVHTLCLHSNVSLLYTDPPIGVSDERDFSKTLMDKPSSITTGPSRTRKRKMNSKGKSAGDRRTRYRITLDKGLNLGSCFGYSKYSTLIEAVHHQGLLLYLLYALLP